MSLTQQFLIVSIFPLSFLGMVVYLWRSSTKQRGVRWPWTLTLIAAAVWASSIVRLYGGASFTVSLVFTWGIVGRYALSFMCLGVLLTTTRYLLVSPDRRILTITLAAVLLVVAIGFDPVIWPYRIPDFKLVNQPVRHFDLWAAIWVVSWLLPLLISWLFTQQANVNLPNSLSGNQVRYWLLVLILFFIGGMLASIQQPGTPGWQEAGLFMIIPGALLGTISIVKSQLPNLQLALRQLLSRLLGTLIIFGLIWQALSFLTQALATLPTNATRNLILILAAALFTGLFTLIYRGVNELTRRIFLPSLARRSIVMADYSNATGNLPEPMQLGQLFLRIIQSNLAVDDGWFFVTADAPGGKLVLRPLTGLGSEPPGGADFAGNSPFTTYLHHNSVPLVHYDIDFLNTFAEMPATEKAILAKWHQMLYLPLRAGDSLIGVVTLGPKQSGVPYSRSDFELLQALAAQFSPLLAQAQNLASLRQINDYVFRQNQILARDKQHLLALANLYGQFIDVISADLRQPFLDVGKQLHRLQEELAKNNSPSIVNGLSEKIIELKAPIDKLITTAGRIQSRRHFNFQLVYLDEIAQSAVRNLRNMADARRVRVELETGIALPAVYGDRQQLLEAVQNILHNAIKFNKIGGLVTMDCGLKGGDLYLRVIDTGVGMPPERLEKVWDSFAGLHASQNGSKGTGLGLTLARFIVLAHGGRIEAESKYGSGSIFSIYLPMVFEDQVAA